MCRSSSSWTYHGLYGSTSCCISHGSGVTSNFAPPPQGNQLGPPLPCPDDPAYHCNLPPQHQHFSRKAPTRTLHNKVGIHVYCIGLYRTIIISIIINITYTPILTSSMLSRPSFVRVTSTEKQHQVLLWYWSVWFSHVPHLMSKP